jgi:hypothetical protein
MTQLTLFDALRSPPIIHPIYQHIEHLRGTNLACWCPLDQPCHADVLLQLANAPIDTTEA